MRLRRHLYGGGICVKDASIDRLIKKIAPGRVRRGSACPMDENTVAAYLEDRLDSSERADFENHASDCALCQEILALSMKIQETEPAAQTVGEVSSRKNVFFRLLKPVPVLGTVFICALLLMLFYGVLDDSQQKLQKSQVAEVRAPAREAQTEEPSAFRGDLEPDQADLKRAKKSLNAPLLEKRMEETASLLPKEPRASDEIASRPSISNEIASPPPAVSAMRIRETEPQEVAIQKADEGIPHRGEQPISPPVLSAAKSQISFAQGLGQAAFPEDKTEKMEQAETAKSKKLGDKNFYPVSGYWMDKECTEHPEAEILEITSKEPEFESILARYPELADLLPVCIYWEGKNYVLR